MLSGRDLLRRADELAAITETPLGPRIARAWPADSWDRVELELEPLHDAFCAATRGGDQRDVTLERWKGERVVLTMVFTSCQATCPITMGKLRDIQARFDREHLAAHFVIVSFDPARDTPEKLAAYRVATEHTRPNWTFLVGSEEDTRTLAMLLGIKYSRNPTTGDIMHDNKIVLLNGDGEITKELLGLDAPIEDF